MRILRISVLVIACAVMATTVFFYIGELGKGTAPVIYCDAEEIRVSSTATDEELLAYVSADDPEDGDLSNAIIVERGSYFLSHGVTKLNYAVSDSDNNVTVLSKKLIYTDYESPKIRLRSDLVFPRGAQSALADYITAADTIDGDITSRLKMISAELSSLPGSYKVNLKVSNRMGDYRDITVDVIVTEVNYQSIPILLKEYIIYEKVGSTPDFASYIDGLSPELTGYSVGDIRIEAEEFDPDKAGVYNVYYKIYDEENAVVTMTRLIVVSED